MKVSGDASLHAPVQRVWDALNDPAVLVRTIPGCERLEAVGPDRYRMTVTAGVAAIKGSYAGQVALTDQDEPTSFVLTASGAGGPGTVTADVRVALEDRNDGSTLVRYDADAVIGGVIGGVGQRMLTGVARKMAGEFFTAVDGVLTGAAPPVVSSGAAAEYAADGSQRSGVFEAPRPITGSTPGADGRTLLLGGVIGAVIALAGVAVGARVGSSVGRR